jgi:hypothetical protein
MKGIMKTKKIWLVITIIVCLVIVSFVGYIVYVRYFKQQDLPVISNIIKKVANVPKETSVLNGAEVEKTDAERRPIAVMVENHPDSRPQSGLSDASLVYEAITEGGITRFMAVYGPNVPKKVGPVRSARTYYIDWLQEYSALYAHVGGNLDALKKIKSLNIYDLDQFGIGDKAYWRLPQAGKAIEQTMYTSLEKLYEAAKQKNWSLKISPVRELKYLAGGDLNQETKTQSIKIDFSSESYRVDWEYDSAKNLYNRSMAQKPHADAVTGKQITASNIVIQSVSRREAITEINEQGWAMDTIGSGKAWVVRNGVAVEATWKKTDQTSRTLFYDEAGAEIKFVPGVIWYEIVPPDVFNTIKL